MSRSPWRQVYISNNDQGMITLTGFDVKSFHHFLDLFHPVFNKYSPFIDDDGFILKKEMGRRWPQSIESMDCLGLLLAWSRTHGSTMALQLIFGMAMTAVSKYLQFAQRIVIKVLKHNNLAKIRMPSLDELEEYRQAIHNRHPALHNVWGTMDGLKCSIEQAPDDIAQSRYYNGWKSGHFVTAVICSVPDGTIPAIFFNIPGCCHDSQLAD